jgi:hypothetical protein
MKPGQYWDYYHSLLLHNLTNLPNYSPTSPVVVQERDSLFAWDVISDGFDLFLDFHRLIQFSKPLVQIVENMLQGLPYDFFGIHLRVESDWEYLQGKCFCFNFIVSFLCTFCSKFKYF